MAEDSDLIILDQVGSHFSATCAAIGGNDWQRQTPCDDWTLAELVDHVTGGNWFTGHILAGNDADEALSLTRATFDGAHATVVDAISSMEQARTGFIADGILERSVNHVAGRLSGRQALRLRLHDLIVHTWDIGQTISPPAAIPAELVAWGLDELSGPDSLAAGYFAAETVPTSETDDPAGLYLAGFGRR